jgi:putative ABC transport system ATP-binding protein
VEVPVLKGIDLTIEAGEYVSIMGRSGAGKSTLMNILGCMDRPTGGEYTLDGQRIASLDDDALSTIRGRTVGFVFQSFHLLKGLTVLQNVELPMEYQHIPAAQKRLRAHELIERVGLSHRLGHRPSQLSGGECQRVAIARALSNNPRVVLADEPTGNLDISAQGRILELFEALQRETGVTLIMVTHDESVGRKTDRRIVLSDGRVVEDAR